MTLQPGVRIGSYELESLVADSGVADVWKARDLVTGRATALRILPAARPEHPDRFARFDRDMQVLASLNHPNIATVDGIFDADDVRALAVAWVDGPSLADRLRGGPLSIDQAALIAARVADAIGAAHDHAIVHGDLKPTDIKVSDDFTVKVIDVGLTKVFEPEIPQLSDMFPSSSARAMSVIIGTAAYMSPEQVRGFGADTRADVWAFGCIVFEMLTGRPAFGATDITETFAVILGAEPEWTWIPSSVPPALVLLLRTCLKKDASARRQNLSGAAIEIEELVQRQGAHDAVLTDSLFERELKFLKRWVKGRVPRSLELDEDDVVQEALTHAFRRMRLLGAPPEGAMQAYLRQAVMNQIRDEVRRKGRPLANEDEPVPDMPIGPDVEALDLLSERDRELIRARIEQGLSYEQIARLFELPSADAARVSVTRAIQRLAENIRDRRKE